MEERLHDIKDGLPASLVDSADPEAYPLLGYTYFLIQLHNMTNCQSAIELQRYAEWYMYNSYAAELAEKYGQ